MPAYQPANSQRGKRQLRANLQAERKSKIRAVKTRKAASFDAHGFSTSIYLLNLAIARKSLIPLNPLLLLSPAD